MGQTSSSSSSLRTKEDVLRGIQVATSRCDTSVTSSCIGGYLRVCSSAPLSVCKRLRAHGCQQAAQPPALTPARARKRTQEQRRRANAAMCQGESALMSALSFHARLDSGDSSSSRNNHNTPPPPEDAAAAAATLLQTDIAPDAVGAAGVVAVFEAAERVLRDCLGDVPGALDAALKSCEVVLWACGWVGGWVGGWVSGWA